MAFPHDFEGNFEVGSASEWTATVGTQATVKHYKDLARQRAWGMPYQGAYALHAEFGVDTDSYVRSTSIAVSSGTTEDDKFMLYIGKDVTASVTTEVAIMQHLPVVAAVGLRIESGGEIFFGIRSTSAALTVSPIALERGKYYTVELEIDTTGGNTCTARIAELGIEVTTTNAAVTGATTEGWLGILGIGAGSLANVTGSLTLDAYVHDTARIYGDLARFPQRRLITKTEHVFVGAGEICDIQLLAGGGTDCLAEVYDTDVADTARSTLVAMVTNSVSDEAKDYGGRGPIYVYNGAYVVLAGTEPQAIITIGATASYGNEAALRSTSR
tara:strand:- start:6109 stop:7092 length:984 start_codon:yes stop_codon:yes gene_type:complete